MEKLNVKNYNYSLLKFLTPKKIKNGYNIKLVYNQKDFVVQSPICTIEEIIDNIIILKFQISNNFNHFQFHFGLNKQMVDHVEMKSVEYDFTSEPFNYSVEKIDDASMLIKLKTNNETLYFDKTQREMTKYDIKKGDKVAFLMYSKGIFADRKGVNFCWTASQIMKIT
jgi:predicted transcriptional regulator